MTLEGNVNRLGWKIVGVAFLLSAITMFAAELTVEVYKQPGRFAGWPANHGIWSWGNEIVVGFEAGYLHFRKPGEHEHSIDYQKPAEHLLARSLDGGETWQIEKPLGLLAPPGTKVAGVPTETGGKPVQDCPGGFEFTNPDFVMTFRMADVDIGPSRFYCSLNRGKSWQGPFRVPVFGQKGIAARTDYLVNGPSDLTVFLTAAKSNGHEGRVICFRTRDGGKTWSFVSFVTPEPEGPDYAIMPSSVRLPSQAILTAVRYQNWIDLYRSDDDAKTWAYVGRPAPDTENPPSLLRLQDGRLALTYGRRSAPYGIRARLSSDGGKTWSGEIILRNDGGCWDLGYTRSVQRPDGKVVTVYYFNDAPDHERQIDATIWDPGLETHRKAEK
ncbi:MAG TPA: sialidase family protein [Bryobacteraceae bacterium]|nr:sialidase family protein [Bryobacteraceae bacterium]